MINNQNRRSRQRETILKLLRSNNIHPTAEWVYHQVRKSIPRISLGTVYRNLNFLSEHGIIVELQLGGGQNRFDAFTSLHDHFVCTECGCIVDIPTRRGRTSYRSVARLTGAAVRTHTLIYHGVCSHCLKKVNSSITHIHHEEVQHGTQGRRHHPIIHSH